MGLIFKENKTLIQNYPEQTMEISGAVLEAGKKAVQVKLAAFDKEEVEALLRKLDVMYSSYVNLAIAVTVAEEAKNILYAARIVKEETKNRFGGIHGTGAELDLVQLVPAHVGGSILNPAGTASKGLYGGTSAAVYTWLKTFTAATSDDLIPSQVMSQWAGLVYLGFIDPVEVPKVHLAKFTLSGVPTSPQTLNFRVREDLYNYKLPFARLEKPIIVGPKKTQAVDVIGGITGDTKLEPIAVLIAKSEDIAMV